MSYKMGDDVYPELEQLIDHYQAARTDILHTEGLEQCG